MSSQIYRSASRAARSLLSASKASPLLFAYMLQDQEVHAAELEQTFIAIKPDGVQRGLIAEIVSRFERKGFKLVAIKLVVPSKEFAQKHYHDLKERPFFNGLCDFLSSGPVLAMMAAKPLTTEAIALTEKKMDMTLADIIKMSKKTTTKEKKAPRRPIKSQGFLNGISSQHSNRVQRFMDSRASIRQGVLAQRRSNFRGNLFPLTTNAARRAAVMPIRNMRANWNKPRLAPATAQRMAADGGIAGKDTMVVPPKQRPQTLDARFADMKENRMRVMSSQQQAFRDDNHQMAHRRRARQQQQQQVRGVRGGARPGRRPGYAVK